MWPRSSQCWRAASRLWPRYSPEFYAYLKEFGPSRPAGTEETLYWSKEDFGIRPVLRISHQILFPGTGSGSPVLVATNQVYADHYLDAALGVTLAVEILDGRAGRSFYMVAVNRARTRSLSGMLRRMVRGDGAEPEPGGDAQDSECGEIRAGGRSLSKAGREIPADQEACLDGSSVSRP